MAVLTIANINDIAKTTRPDQGVGRFNQIATRLTDYEIMNLMASQSKVVYQGGRSIEGNLLVDHNFSAAMVGLHQVIEPNITDVFQVFSVPWRHTNWNWSYERREGLINYGTKKVADILEGKRIAGEISSVELMEQQIWTKPATSANETDIFGIPYWVIQRTTSGAGFDGGNPTGFASGAGNVDSATYTRWKNYNAQYAAITVADLSRKMKGAYRKTDFKSPVTHADYEKGGAGYMHRIYMNEATIDGLEQLMGSNNDQHGHSLTEFMDATSFKRQALRYVPKLDDDAKNPIYMLDMRYMCIGCLSGDDGYEHDPMNSVNQPNTWVVHHDRSWNMICTDRRRQAVINLA